jgi:hypothetical protein
MPDNKKPERGIIATDSGAAVQKNVSQLREGQKPTKPAELSRPAGIVPPPPPQANSSQKK